MDILEITDTSAIVKALPPAGNPNIVSYKAVINPTKQCSIDSGASPLQCEIGGLQPYTEYVVSLSSCMPVAVGCGSAVTKTFKTKPAGRFMLPLV